MQRETQILVSFDLVFHFILVASGEIFDLSYGKIWGHASFVTQARDEDVIHSVIVVLSMETYFELVWSRFNANDEGN